MIQQIVSSNAVQLATVFGAGGLGYLAAARWPVVIAIVGFAAAALLAVSFTFDTGEVYSYTTFYKRAFSHLGDDVTTWLTPLMTWAVLSRRQLLATAVAAGILLSGTKISLVLLLLQYMAVLLICKGRRRTISVAFWTSLAVAAAVYLTLVLASPHLVRTGGAEPATQRCAGGGECLAAQVTRPVHDRGLSAVAGLWMTLQGGFPGARYPDTPEKFADLMMQANPWGINDSFSVTHAEWIRMGTVQTPYLHFGAGYGILPLAALLLGLAAIGWIGTGNIRDGERGPFVAFTVFFVINAVVNQTQPWLTRGPILFLMGFCAMHILQTYRSRERHGRNAPA